MHYNDLELKCTSTSLSWERAYLDDESNVFSPKRISVSDIVSVASDVQSEFCMLVQRLKEDVRDEIICLLVEFFPIMLAVRNKKTVLVVINELLLEKEAFTVMLSGDDEACTMEDDEEEEVTVPEGGNNGERANEDRPNKRCGRAPLYIRFPTLIDVAIAFIKEYSFSAIGRPLCDGERYKETSSTP